MRVGVDGRKLPGAADLGGPASVARAHELGMEGVFFRTLTDLTETLDRGILRETRAEADAHGMYLEMGIAKINPYAHAESPEVRQLGDGDYTKGFIKMMQEAVNIGCRELWVATASYKPKLPGYYVFDRFRTDATWNEQLLAVQRFLRLLAPVCRDLGVHLNIETHEEITSFEILRLLEAVGEDVIGITFDSANVVARGEDPLEAARRVAPWTRMSHVRDVAMFHTDYGLGRLLAPCGEGVYDWMAILSILHEHNPDLNLSIENARNRAVMPIHHSDEAWRALHPDLIEAELAEVISLADRYAVRAEAGEVQSIEHMIGTPCDEEEQLRFIDVSAQHLRGLIEEGGF